MAILFMDGFDCYDAIADVYANGNYASNTNVPGFSKTAGRFGGGAKSGSID